MSLMSDLKSIVTSAINDLERANFSWWSHEKAQLLLEKLQNVQSRELNNRQSLRHLSASMVVRKQDKMVFIEHPYLHQTLLPAGHVEPGEIPIETAVRELMEETGLAVAGDNHTQLIDINIISIPANPIKGEGPHEHIDLRYRVSEVNQTHQTPELPVSWLTYAEAPVEFQPYFGD